MEYNFENLKLDFEQLGNNYKTKDVDKLNKRLIKQGVKVDFLKHVVLAQQQYHRTYFQVSMGLLKTTDQKLNFVEENYQNLADWWHVDQLTQFVGKLDLNNVYQRAQRYVEHPHPFLRRWGYVIFMPTLVQDANSFHLITSLLKNDDEYYVVMAQAWLISFLAIYHPTRTLEYLQACSLDYNIVGKAIQKICDSFRIPAQTKEQFKALRKLYK